MQYKISYCTTCKGRLHHLKETLPANIKAAQNYANLEFVVLDYGDKDSLRGWIKDSYADLIESGRLVFAQNPHARNFKMAHAKNMAHRLASGDILVNVDADNFVPDGFAQYLNHNFGKKKNIYLAMGKQDSQTRAGCSGRIALGRGDFYLIGGYDEKFAGWGPDDKDLNRRLEIAGLSKVEITDYFLDRIEHSDHERLKNLPNEKKNFKDFKLEQKLSMARGDSGECIANNGNVGCGEVYLNFSSELTRIEPIATRIFGIGMHKTGTTSLAAAFDMLGLRTSHWNNTLHEKLVYNRPLTEVQKNYMLCDIPIPLYYPYLDHQFPGSRFILTTRDEGRWLNSVKKHMGFEYVRWKKQGKGFPKTHAAHLCTYGTPFPDDDRLLQVFRQHNEGAIEYFRKQPGDLLVIDLSIKEDDSARWRRICDFVNIKDIPSEPYPVKFTTESRERKHRS